MRIPRLAELYRLGNDRLSKYQDFLLVSVLVIAASLTALILVRILTKLGSPSGLSDGPAILWEGEREDPEPVTTKYKSADGKDGNGGSTAPLKPQFPQIDWSDPDRRRRAASVLSLRGDFKSAIELLPPDDPERGELEEITGIRHERVLQALEEILAAEEAAQKLPGKPEQFEENKTHLLPRWIPSLPEKALYRFVVNLHCKLQDRTGASDGHLKLLLDSCFPSPSPARKLYLESKALHPIPNGSPSGDPVQVK